MVLICLMDAAVNPSEIDAVEAFERGRAMNTDLLQWDPWPHMGRPLDAVRAELGAA